MSLLLPGQYPDEKKDDQDKSTRIVDEAYETSITLRRKYPIKITGNIFPVDVFSRPFPQK